LNLWLLWSGYLRSCAQSARTWKNDDEDLASGISAQDTQTQVTQAAPKGEEEKRRPALFSIIYSNVKIMGKKNGGAAGWRFLKSAEAPALFVSGALRWGVLGLIEGLATFAEEEGLHLGGVLGWDGKTHSSRSLQDDLFAFSCFCLVLSFVCWLFVFVFGVLPFFLPFFLLRAFQGWGGFVGVDLIL